MKNGSSWERNTQASCNCTIGRSPVCRHIAGVRFRLVVSGHMELLLVESYLCYISRFGSILASNAAFNTLVVVGYGHVMVLVEILMVHESSDSYFLVIPPLLLTSLLKGPHYL